MPPESKRTVTVGAGGVIQVVLPEFSEGETVEVSVRSETQEPRKLGPSAGLLGKFQGQIHIREDFDDPLPEMEPYV